MGHPTLEQTESPVGLMFGFRERYLAQPEENIRCQVTAVSLLLFSRKSLLILSTSIICSPQMSNWRRHKKFCRYSL